MPLYIISTPIGNLKDITLRALETLKEVDLILAEDTRRTSILLNHYGIKNKLQSYNDHNKEKTTPKIISELKQGKNIALVSDAGTPAISDPGFYLTREAIKYNIQIIPIPGPTAAISALTISGFPTDSFTFYGFIPKKGKENFFRSLPNNTIILYESPYRIIKTLETIKNILPKRKICIARELTKKFEETIIGFPEELYEKLKDKKIKGEITLLISKE